jgi:hypothetical protein
MTDEVNPNYASPETIDIGPEMFMDVEGNAISYKGENFYRACSEFVMNYPDGSTSFCVKRKGHPNSIHEDAFGNTNEYGGGIQEPEVSDAVSVTTMLTATCKNAEEVQQLLELHNNFAKGVAQAKIHYYVSISTGGPDATVS